MKGEVNMKKTISETVRRPYRADAKKYAQSMNYDKRQIESDVWNHLGLVGIDFCELLKYDAEIYENGKGGYHTIISAICSGLFGLDSAFCEIFYAYEDGAKDPNAIVRKYIRQ